MTSDVELLRQYAKNGSEAAFAELVRRQMNLVYSVALRLTSGNAHLAQDVAQSVFTDLARKAGPLSHHETLAGWLHTSTRFAALQVIRSERRRQTYEQEASAMQPDSTNVEFDWEQLGPVLDEAVGRLRAHERDVVVLRFFQGLSYREVGEALGLNENAACKRVDHALEKLRAYFARSGITVSSALLASAITTNSVQAAPAGLAGKITGPSLAGAAGHAGGAGALFLLLRIMFMSTKIKTTVTAVILAVLIALTIAGIWWYTEPMPAPAKVALAPASAKSPIDPKSSALRPPPSAPMAPPPAQTYSVEPPNPATPARFASNDPQADLKTVIPDIARLIRTGNQDAFKENYAPPGKLDPQQIEQLRLQQQKREALAGQDQDFAHATQLMNEAFAQSYEALANQTPTLNATGDEATYMVMIPSTSDMTNGVFTNTGTPSPMVFVKINGKWYIK